MKQEEINKVLDNLELVGVVRTKGRMMSVTELKSKLMLCEKPIDTWNLADEMVTRLSLGKEEEIDYFEPEDIKTFIQKVKEKKYVFSRGASFMDGIRAVLEEIDKRAGKLEE